MRGGYVYARCVWEGFGRASSRRAWLCCVFASMLQEDRVEGDCAMVMGETGAVERGEGRSDEELCVGEKQQEGTVVWRWVCAHEHTRPYTSGAHLCVLRV